MPTTRGPKITTPPQGDPIVTEPVTEEKIPFVEDTMTEQAEQPTEQPEEAKEEAKEAGVNFARAVWLRTQQQARRVGTAIKRAPSKGEQAAKKAGWSIRWAARKGWTGLKKAGRVVALGVTGALALVGVTLYYVLLAVAWVVVGLIAGVAFLAIMLVFILFKIVHLVALVLCSAWMAMNSRDGLKEAWQRFREAIRLSNLDKIEPQTLATYSRREREQRAAQRAAWAEETQRATQQTARTAGKGRATPKNPRQQGAPRRFTPSPAQG